MDWHGLLFYVKVQVLYMDPLYNNLGFHLKSLVGRYYLIFFDPI